MNNIFRKLLYKEVLTNYIDNFVILAKTKKEWEEQMIHFLKIVEKNNFYFRRSKCNFDMEKISILGVVTGQEEVQIENDKVKAIKEWKTSTKIKKVEKNGFKFSFCNIDVGVRQGSALSSILFTLYLSFIFHILEKWLKILKIPIFIISFVDDGLFIL